MPKVTYQDLVNVGGTIYSKSGKGYRNPQELAADLGILPHQIDWTKIEKSSRIPTPPTPEKDKGFPSPPPSVKVSPKEVPEQLAPEKDLAGIRKIFGPNWKPAPIFYQRGLVDKGIYGAVRVKGSPNVFTIGPDGGLETPESFKQKFGTLNQKGIVGVIDRETAVKLGIQPASIDRPPSKVISVEDLEKEEKPIQLPEPEAGVDTSDATVKGAETYLKGIDDYIKLLTPEETETQKQLDKLVADYLSGAMQLEKKGAMQLEEEEKRGIPQKKAELLKVKNQIQTRIAQFNQIKAQLDQLKQQVEEKPISMAHIYGEQAQIQKRLMLEKNSMKI